LLLPFFRAEVFIPLTFPREPKQEVLPHLLPCDLSRFWDSLWSWWGRAAPFWSETAESSLLRQVRLIPPRPGAAAESSVPFFCSFARGQVKIFPHGVARSFPPFRRAEPLFVSPDRKRKNPPFLATNLGSPPPPPVYVCRESSRNAPIRCWLPLIKMAIQCGEIVSFAE